MLSVFARARTIHDVSLASFSYTRPTTLQDTSLHRSPLSKSPSSNVFPRLVEVTQRQQPGGRFSIAEKRWRRIPMTITSTERCFIRKWRGIHREELIVSYRWFVSGRHWNACQYGTANKQCQITSANNTCKAGYSELNFSLKCELQWIEIFLIVRTLRSPL